jgi:hypothetical protein
MPPPHHPVGGSATSRRTLLLIATLTLLVAALALCINRALNGDLYLELFTGRFITEHGLVSHDPFATVAHGRPWLNQQWLAELGFYAVAKAIGITGLTILYAILIAAPLALVMWAIRGKGATMLIAAAVLYFPGLLAIVHPRAAAFTLLAFSALVVLVLAAWRPTLGGAIDAGRLRWPLLGILLLFALWANLHGGFVAGLLLIALATAGLTVDTWRRLPGAIGRHRVALLGLTGILAAAVVTVATPLGDGIWAYVLSFRNPAISLGSKEWEPATHSALAMLYLCAAACFSAWLWWRAPAPRRLMPPLIAAGFLVFAASSMRNIIFVAPALVFQIACSRPDRAVVVPRLPIAIAGSAALAAVLTWVAVLGPARTDAVGPPAVQYALAHPPERGRIAAYAGASSYILWRAPRTPVVIDGWLEHFTPTELRANYGILRGWGGDPTPYVRRFHVGAVIAHLPVAIDALEAHGFTAEYSGPGGTYLVREPGSL